MKLRKEMEQELKSIAVEMANSAKAIAERKIIDKGFGEKYSEAGAPAFFLLEKTLNNKGKAFLKKKIKNKELATWRELREAQGLQGDYVDLYYSG
jgi:hypothetical protein